MKVNKKSSKSKRLAWKETNTKNCRNVLIKENKRNYMRNLRAKEAYRFKEQVKNKERVKDLRKNEAYSKAEKHRNADHIRVLRANEKHRLKENMTNRRHMRILRKNEEYYHKEKHRNSERIKVMRNSKYFQFKEKMRNKGHMRVLRRTEDYCVAEKYHNRKRINTLRENNLFVISENIRKRLYMGIVRKCKRHRCQENKRNKKRMKLVRKNVIYTEKEKRKNRNSKKIMRSIDIFKGRENYFSYLKSEPTKKQVAIKKFLNEKLEIPSNICFCCEGLFFHYQGENCNIAADFKNNKSTSKRKSSLPAEFYEKICNYDSHFCCRTCIDNIRRNKIPKLATSNGLGFPEIPEFLKDLSPLEERMVSPIINFMQIRPLKQYALNAQLGMAGSVVNIPIEIKEMQKCLPRKFNEMHTIQIKLKRHVLHKSNYMFETVRPDAITRAMEYLKDKPLMKKYDIVMDTEYELNHKNVKQQEFVIEDKDRKLIDFDTELLKDLEFSDNEDEEDECADEHVMLLNRDFKENIQIIAPGQGKHPLPWYEMENMEELSFPTIYGGFGYNIPVHLKVSYADRVRSECRRVDRRACNKVKVLYMAKKKLQESVINSINTCLRKGRIDPNINAGRVKNSDFLNNLFIKADAYKILKNVRSSPPYWQGKRNNLYAMIAQLGLPTFFFTISTSELTNPELLKCLAKFSKKGLNFSRKQAYEMDKSEKTSLIRDDPVTCARIFHHRVHKLMQLLREKNGIFGDYYVEDSYERVEFQVRGSPHKHILLWLANNPPNYDSNSPESTKQCIEFIDKFITCENDSNNELMVYQKHKHTFTCYKYSKAEKRCRFNYPIPCMRTTQILEPLNNDDKTQKISNNYISIKALMEDLSKNPKEMSFDEILSFLKITEEDYILAVRSSVQDHPKVFLKRGSLDVNYNAYNKDLLALIESNMDIQFVTNIHQLVSYMVNYIGKIEGGISKLLRDAVSDQKYKDLGIKEKFNMLGNIFVNKNLMSAQEAAYHCLSLPLSTASRKTIFVNTSPKDERVFMLKSAAELAELPDDSTNIFKENQINRYTRRPKKDEKKCLAVFATEYGKKKHPKADYECESDEGYDDPEYDPETELNKRRRILRYPRCKYHQNPTGYFREQLFLFHSWRNEESDIDNVNVEDEYNRHISEIESNRSLFSIIPDEILEDVMDQVYNNEVVINQEDMDEFKENGATESQLIDLQIGKEKRKRSHMVPKKDCSVSRYIIPKRVSKEEVHSILRGLNEKQHDFVMYILQWIKTKSEPLCVFLSGSAGVGKSTVINALYQSITHYFDSVPGQNVDEIFVLICASTGIAAFGVGGVTLHGAFAFPINRKNGIFVILSDSLSSEVLAKLRNLKVLIIDEISMVGATLLINLDLRLRQILGNDIPFGGVIVIVCGHLSQLPPVKDCFVFKTPSWVLAHELFDVNPVWHDFKYYELKEIMRQKGDIQFAKALNNLADGTLTDMDIKLFQTREVLPSAVPKDVIHLFTTNAAKDEYNQKRIKEGKGEVFVSAAVNHILDSKKNNLKSIKDLLSKLTTQELNGLPDKLQIKVGLRYMITSNIDIADGLVNGNCGILRRVDFNPNKLSEPVRLWLEFSDPRVGVKAKLPYSGKMQAENISMSLVPIEIVKIHLNVSMNWTNKVVRSQFPLVVAEAFTIHKCQGSTHQRICVDFRNATRLTRQHQYVAFSRVTSLSGLYILGKFKPISPSVSDVEIRNETERLRKKQRLQLFIEPFKKFAGFKIMYLNINGLSSKLRDITSDNNYLCSDVLVFAETNCKNGNLVSIENYRLLFISVKNKGLSIFIKNSIPEFPIEHHLEETEFWHLELVLVCASDFFFITGYCSPKTPFSKFVDVLQVMIKNNLKKSEKLLVMGDFNFNMTGEMRSKYSDAFKNLHLYSQLKKDVATTINGTQIDLILSNFEVNVCGIYDTYFSDHRTIFAAFNFMENNSESVSSEPEITEKSSQINTRTEWQKIIKEMGKVGFPVSLKSIQPDPSKIKYLDYIEKNIIDMDLTTKAGLYAINDHITAFHKLIEEYSNYTPTDINAIYITENIEKTKEKHLQILRDGLLENDSVGHYYCAYYDGKGLHIFDSLNRCIIGEESMEYVKTKFGKHISSKIQYHTVISQQNAYDCGIFAMAFATSIVFGRHPDKENYDCTLIRNHANTMLKNRILKLFPIEGTRLSENSVERKRKISSEYPDSPRKIHKPYLETFNVRKRKVESDIVEVCDHLVKKRRMKQIDLSITNLIYSLKTNLPRINDISYEKYIEDAFNQDEAQGDTLLKLGSFVCLYTITAFHQLINEYTIFNPGDKYLTLGTEPIIEKCDRSNLQILFEGDVASERAIGHWICSFFDGNRLHIFDSLNKNSISERHIECLSKLYGGDVVEEAQYHRVDQQKNGIDCGLYAMAFATSICYGILPDCNIYDPKTIRKHAYEMIRNKTFKLFPTVYDIAYVSVVNDKRPSFRLIKYGTLSENDIRQLYNQRETYAKDLHMDAFSELIKFYTPYKPQSTTLIQRPACIKANPHKQKNIQFLFHGDPNDASAIGHWICTFFDGTRIHIYDSFNSNLLRPMQIKYLQKLYGVEAVSNVLFHRVQAQTNLYDCGIYAMAYATSICFGRPPDTEKYDISKMRQHCVSVLINRKLSLFP